MSICGVTFTPNLRDEGIAPTDDKIFRFNLREQYEANLDFRRR